METVFSKIIEGTIPSKKVFENERILAFYDIEPAAPVHVLIIPKKFIASMNDVTPEDLPLIAEIHSVASSSLSPAGWSQAGCAHWKLSFPRIA